MAAVSDENSVVFVRNERDAMYQVKVAIEDALAGPDPAQVAPMAAPAPAPAGPPAGWYADGNDATVLRWWDGTRWTEHTRPAELR